MSDKEPCKPGQRAVRAPSGEWICISKGTNGRLENLLIQHGADEAFVSSTLKKFDELTKDEGLQLLKQDNVLEARVVRLNQP